MEKNQGNWDDLVPYCCSAYRKATHSTTQYTSNNLMLGRELPLPSHLQHAIPQEPVKSKSEYVEQMAERMQEAHPGSRGKYRKTDGVLQETI